MEMDRAQATLILNFIAGAAEGLFDPQHIFVPIGARFIEQLGIIFILVVLIVLVVTALGKTTAHLHRENS